MRMWRAWTTWWDSEDQGAPLIRETVFTEEEVVWITEMDEKKGRVDRRPTGGGGGGAQARVPACNVIEALRGVCYPLTVKDLLKQLHDKGIDEVLWSGKPVSVSQVLGRFPEVVLLSREDVENVIASQLGPPTGQQPGTSSP
jgi:hypothetical protein